jgi:hypothetical protein
MTQSAFDPAKHIPVLVDVPQEEVRDMQDRPDIPPPSAYARTAVVTHRKTKQRAVIHRVDLVTRQLRLWYPDRAHLPHAEQFDTRTGWQSFDDWEPEIQFSPEEIKRQEAAALFQQELEAFDSEGLELVTVFCDDPDPVKALAKLRALKRSQIVKTKADVAAETAGAAPSMPQEPPRKQGR